MKWSTQTYKYNFCFENNAPIDFLINIDPKNPHLKEILKPLASLEDPWNHTSHIKWSRAHYSFVTARIRRLREGKVFSHVCLFTGGSLCNPYPWCQWSVTGHMGTFPFSNLFIWDPSPSSDLFKLIHLGPSAGLFKLVYLRPPLLPCTSFGNRTVGSRLKSLLV